MVEQSGSGSMDMRDRISSEMTGIERLIAKIPGYRGYKEKEMAREADALLREQLTEELRVEIDRLNEIQREFMNSGNLSLLDDLGVAIQRLETLRDTIRTAAYGYAGMFDAIKVGEAELDILYEHDLGLLDSIPSLTAAIDQVQRSISDRPALENAISALMGTIMDIRRRWDMRRQSVRSLSANQGLAP